MSLRFVSVEKLDICNIGKTRQDFALDLLGSGTYRFDSEDADLKRSCHLIDHEYDEMPLSQGCEGAHDPKKDLGPNDLSIINYHQS